eukprot:14944648-Alexandrium_andersonii.AAC.1
MATTAYKFPTTKEGHEIELRSRNLDGNTCSRHFVAWRSPGGAPDSGWFETDEPRGFLTFRCPSASTVLSK